VGDDLEATRAPAEEEQQVGGKATVHDRDRGATDDVGIHERPIERSERSRPWGNVVE
jgi:hypothetical protein